MLWEKRSAPSVERPNKKKHIALGMYAKKIEPTFYPEKSYDYKDINTEIMCHKIKQTTNAIHVKKCIRKLVE